MAARFGTSGLRGLVEELSRPVCQAYTRAFVRALVGPGVGIALGIDRRPSSPAIAQFCFEAARAEGREVEFCGILPTPALAWYAQTRGMAAIMVTGSHISFDRNGIKFYTPHGEISKDDEGRITAHLEWEEAPQGALPEASPRALGAYVDRAMDAFGPGGLSGWRVGVYEHSSASREVLCRVLEQCGAQVVGLGRTDSFVALDTEALSAQDRALAQQWVGEHGLQALLSTDGDGDRPMLADATGTWWRGDVLGLVAATALGIACVALPVSCTTAVEGCGRFAQVRRTRIGSPYVVAAMEELLGCCPGPVAGFEANGGFLLGSDLLLEGRLLQRLPTRDALVPLVAVLHHAARRGVPVAQLRQELPQRWTASQRLQDFPNSKSQELLALLAVDTPLRDQLLAAAAGTVLHLDTTDGLRWTFSSGEILHLRPSGNAPELRCYAEATSLERAEALVEATLVAVGAWVRR